ncbi:hypothetical protein BKA70DRAFT_1520857 [Coprinopsis sp. MPI-PUGE-AT-0042]|nr:hypothetical protein BKA70DRAFT_1520857 [Coprinopsis sp. MPI-PUGE-AT-0042]
MSAGDALAAIHTIHGIVSKVKDNKDELKCLSTRLQFIVESLESRQRDVIRDAEYEASLSTVFGSLGGRTWNAGEITGDLRRLNEDVQAFLSVHTVKTLDLVQTAQSQQQTYLVTTIEEIIAKITEMDLALSRQRPVPNLPAPPATMMAMTSSDLQPLQESSVSGGQSSDGPSHRLAGRNELGRASARGDTARNSSVPQAYRTARITEADPEDLEKVDAADLANRLITQNMVTVTTKGLHKKSDGEEPYGQGAHEATFRVPGTANVEHIKKVIVEAGYHRPENFEEDDTIRLTATDGDSVFDATAPGGLQVNKKEPLLWWMNKYEEYHGKATPIPMKTEVEWHKDSLQIGDLTTRCHRTLRVPDGDNTSDLPPVVTHLGSKVPEEMKKRGGFITPMFLREALYIQFSGGDAAVKVSVGGVNVVSGASASDLSPLGFGTQDYIVAGKQPWIDGIVTGPGVVRQFVVTEMHKGYTVEEQVTGESKVGGIQFDIYPRRSTSNGQFYKEIGGDGEEQPSWERCVESIATPEELETLFFSSKRWEALGCISSSPSSNWTAAGYAQRLSPHPIIQAIYREPPSLAFSDFSFGVQSSLEGYERAGIRISSSSMASSRRQLALGISAGGRIKQRIYHDTESIRVYNEQLAQRCHIHIVSPTFWEDLTGILPPATPVTRDIYVRHGIPWFSLFDDYVASITETSQTLAAVRSVSDLDTLEMQKAAREAQDAVIDPDSPPFCPQHRRSRSVCVFRPCGHTVCHQCLGFALMGGSKYSCGAPIAKFVGMKRPMAEVTAPDAEADDAEEMDEWNVKEIEELSLGAVQQGKVIVIHLNQDNVAPLQQRKVDEPTRTPMSRGMSSNSSWA